MQPQISKKGAAKKANAKLAKKEPVKPVTNKKEPAQKLKTMRAKKEPAKNAKAKRAKENKHPDTFCIEFRGQVYFIANDLRGDFYMWQDGTDRKSVV